MDVDCIIVGFGIAGMAMAFQLEKEGKSVVIIDGNHTKASLVAAGLYNPVILKRFTLAWGAESQMQYAHEFYADLSVYLNIVTTTSIGVFRKFNNAQEQNKWFSRIDNPQLKKYLNSNLKRSPSKAISSPYDFGEVKHTGKVEVQYIYEAYRNLLKSKKLFIDEEFNYDDLSISSSKVTYREIHAKQIVFCEGFQMIHNPYFKHLPLVGNKGCYLIIESEDLALDVAVKSYYFIVPLGGNRYKFGATYEHRFKENHDVLAKQELINRLNDLINVSYKIVDFIVGTRPTVIDRRPLLGSHSLYNNVYLLNGMGTRGVLLAPTASEYLKDFMLNDKPLPAEMDSNRFS